MTRLVSRDEWGARAPRSTSGNIRPEGVTVHYGGPSPWSGVDRTSAVAFRRSTDHARCPSIWRAWQAFHMDGNKWADIAYTSGACPHGVRYEGRGPGRRTAAQGTTAGNARSYAVCYIAGGNDPLTDDARAAFLDEGARLKPLRWGHQDWKSTACPGVDLWAWRQAGFPGNGSTPSPDSGEIEDMNEDQLERVMTRVLDRQVTMARQAGKNDAWWQQARVQHGSVVESRRLLEHSDRWSLLMLAAVRHELARAGVGDGTGEDQDLEEIAEFVADAARQAVREELPLVLSELDVELPADLEAVVNEGLARRILGEEA